MFSCLCATLLTIGNEERDRSNAVGRTQDCSAHSNRDRGRVSTCVKTVYVEFQQDSIRKSLHCRTTYVVEKRFDDRKRITTTRLYTAKRSTYVQSTWVRRTRSCRSHTSTNSIVPRTSRGCRTCLACTSC